MVNTQGVRLEGCPSCGIHSGCHVRGLNHMVNNQSVRHEGCPSGGPYSGCHVRGLNHMVNTQSVWLGGFPLQEKLFSKIFKSLRNFVQKFYKSIPKKNTKFYGIVLEFSPNICNFDMHY